MTTQTDLPKKKRKKKRRKSKKQTFLHFLPHILFFVAVIVIVAIGVIKLSAWNKGVKSDYDPNATDTGFDTESMDFYSAPNEKQKDTDGVNSILLMGNNMLADHRGDSDGIAALLEKYSGGKVYDISVDRSFISVKNFPFKEEYPGDVFSFYWMANCLANNDLTLIRDYSKVFEGDDDIADIVATMESIDMSTIDTLVIFYDHHDYEAKRMLHRVYNQDQYGRQTDTCVECLSQGIQLIQQNYPQIRIIVSSPYYNFVEVDGKLVPAGETPLKESTDLEQYGTLADYLIAYMNTAAELGCSFVDNYIGTINADNYKEYLDDELKYPNAEGRDLLAKRIAKFVNPQAE